jgi:hypothetical protein
VALPPIESERPVWDYYDGYRDELGAPVEDEPVGVGVRSDES